VCASRAAFVCPFAAASVAACGCAPPCRAACGGGGTTNTTGAQAACSGATTACYLCLLPLLTAAVPQVADVPSLAQCLLAPAPQFLAAGAAPAALQAVRSCAFVVRAGRPNASTACPVALPPAAFAPAVPACADSSVVAGACQGSCSVALLRVWRDAGVAALPPAFGPAFTPAHYELYSDCVVAHSLAMLNAGMSYTTFVLGYGFCTAASFALPLAGGAAAAAASNTNATTAARTARAAVTAGAAAGACGGAALAACVFAAVWQHRRVVRRQRAGASTALPSSSPKGTTSAAAGAVSTAPAGQHDVGGALLLDYASLELGELLGSGAFGHVHRARWHGSEVAVKTFGVLPLQPDVTTGFSAILMEATARSSAMTLASRTTAVSASFELELKILLSLRHPNICALYGSLQRCVRCWPAQERVQLCCMHVADDV
jgi:hypothetical protein